MSAALIAADGRRFRTFKARCICAGTMGPCWQARCQCGVALTKHCFTEDAAEREARAALADPDARPGFGHRRCRATQ